MFLGEKKIDEKLKIVSEHLRYQYRLVQYKPNFSCFGKTGFRKTDLIWWFSTGKGQILSKNSDVIVDTGESLKFNHPSIKPEKTVRQLLKMFTKENDVILDVFLGSGTTMIACQDLKRSCIGIEINPEYCEIVRKRCFGRKFLDREVDYQFQIWDGVKG